MARGSNHPRQAALRPARWPSPLPGRLSVSTPCTAAGPPAPEDPS
ncbi:hypothetical protein ACFFX0_12635 [Citricoccus parietis]|uniref:Uncharacterized protein n=1 Tax=Citricoccus parietis TaxID=592307 RepID=A0ABV5FZ85_9MICC